MVIAYAKIKLYAEWVQSLKDKRSMVKSLTEKIKNRFNVSAAEVECEDIHQTAVIAVCCVSNDKVYAEALIGRVVNYIEGNTDAATENVYTEVFTV